MPRPQDRTRSRRRRPSSFPWGQHGAQFKPKMIRSPKCGNCNNLIHQLPHSQSKIRKLSRTQRQVNRVYGGQLCHQCVRDLLRQASRTI